MERRLFTLYIALILCIAGFAFCAGCVGEDAGQQTPAPTATPTYTATPTVEPTNDNTGSFSGAGDQKTTMPLSAGVHMLTLEMEKPDGSEPGASTVSISTENDAIMVEGNYTPEVRPDAIIDGHYHWTYAFMLEEEADATVEVSQLAPWTLHVGVPKMINGIPPQTFTGVGNKATPFFMIPAGNYSCQITGENMTVISVGLMDYNGTMLMDDDRVAPLAFHQLRNEDFELYVGDYATTVPVTIKEGDNYLFNIICDGRWSVTFSPVE
jgi:hypothetical protein